MFFHKTKIIDRNVLRILISHQCNNQSFIPLNKYYKLVPNLKWLVRRTPIFFTKDCNKRAHKTVNNMVDYAGMVVVSTDDPLIDHCLVIVCMEENMKIMYYDPSKRALTDPKQYKLKREIWL